MNPSWLVIAGGSSLSVSPPHRKVNVPVGPAGLADGCATGVHAATSVAAPAARSSSRLVKAGDLIGRYLPSRNGGEHSAVVSVRHADPEQQAVLLDRRARHQEEHDARDRGGDPRERLAEEVDHLAEVLALLHASADAHAAAEEPLDRRTQPLESVDHARPRHLSGGTVEHP